MDKKKVILLTIGIGFITFIFIIIMFVLTWTDTDKVPSNDQSENIDALSPGEDEREKEDEIVSFGETLEKARAFSRIRAFNKSYDMVIEIDEETLSEEELEELKAYRGDLLLLSQLQTQIENGMMDEMMYSIKNMNEPESFMIGFLGLPNDYKMKLMFSGLSLLPPPNPNFKNPLTTPIVEENHVTRDVFARDTNVEEIYAMKMTIDGDDLTAYIVKNHEGFYIYTIEGDPEYMITVDEYNEFKGGDTFE